jgi:hypothetical protein
VRAAWRSLARVTIALSCAMHRGDRTGVPVSSGARPDVGRGITFDR